MNTHGMDILHGLVTATPTEPGRADPRSYELPRQLIEARRLVMEGDLGAAEAMTRAALATIESTKGRPCGNGLPFGYETAYGFFIRVDPDLFKCVDDLVEFCDGVERDAREICAKRGLKVETAIAHPDVIAEGGDPFCPAFPLTALEAVYGAMCSEGAGECGEVWI